MLLPLALVCVLTLYTLIRGRWRREHMLLNAGFLTGCAVKLLFLMFPSTTKSLLMGEGLRMLVHSC
jgi:hypothetical protein